MKKILLILSIFTFLLLGMAGCGRAIGESGTWTGEGSYHDDAGESHACEVRAEFQRYDSWLDVSKVASDCGARYSAWGPASFSIVGTELRRDNKKVGEISEQGGHFELADEARKLSVQISWQRHSDKMVYREEVFTMERKHSITASLER